MRVLVDTNVVLDVLLAREPHVRHAAEVFALIERSQVDAAICATTITTVHYLLAQSLEPDDARNALRELIELFEIAPVNRPVIEQALQSRILDFEDAVLEQAARLVGAETIITRNTKDFSKSTVKALDPVAFLSAMGM